MLTIRAIHPSGSESLFQARHVIVEPARDVDPKMRRRVDFYDEHMEAIFVAGLPYIEYGSIYVMSESGRTVATYDLGSATEAEHAS